MIKSLKQKQVANLDCLFVSRFKLSLTFKSWILSVTKNFNFDWNLFLFFQIIRGRTLFKLTVHEDEFALMVTLSKMHNLELPALRGKIFTTSNVSFSYTLLKATFPNRQF